MGILEELKRLVPDEIIDDSNVEETAKMVDLDIAYRLFVVTDFVHQEDVELFDNIPDVIELKKRPDGNYEIRKKLETGPDFQIVGPDEAKVMRARFLLLKAFYSSNLEAMPCSKQSEAVSKYDIGFIPKF